MNNTEASDHISKNCDQSIPFRSKTLTLVWILILLPTIIAIGYVLVFAENVPTGHDWVSFQIYKAADNAAELISLMWSPQNGARAFFPQLVYYLDFTLFDFNTYHMLFITLMLMMVSLLGIFRIMKSELTDKMARIIPIAWLWFSLIQYKDLLTGWHFLFHLSTTAFIWSMIYIRKDTHWGTIVASLLFCLGFYSFGSGAAIFPAGLVLLLLSRKEWKDIIIWLTMGSLIVGFYFYKFKFGDTISNDAMITNLVESVRLFLQLQGNSLVALFGYFGSIGELAVTISGLILQLYAVCLLWILWRSKHPSKEVITALLTYSYFVFALIVFGRVQRGVEVATAYVTVPIIYAITVYYASLSAKDNSMITSRFLRFCHSLLVAVMIGSSILGFIYGMIWGPYVKGDRIKQRYKILHYEDYDYETSASAYLEENNKSIFKDTIRDDLYLHVFELDKFKDTSPAYIYDSESSRDYTMINPVEKIRSIGILAHVHSMDAKDSLVVEIHHIAEDHAVIRRAISSKDILLNGRASFPVEGSTLAMGDTLLIKISTSGSTIKIPLYRPYPGSPMLLSGESEELNDRTISIEFNPPKQLKGYYRQLALRNRLKLWKNKITKKAA